MMHPLNSKLLCKQQPVASVPRSHVARPAAASRRVIARTADVPLHHPHHDSLGSADAGDESRCPFLAALRTPPMVNMPWLQRVKYQVFAPAQYQAQVLRDRGEHTIVQGRRQPGFNSFFMPATGELAKAVFAEEPGGTITQGLAEKGGFRAFGTLLGEDSLLVVKDPARHAYLRALLQPAFGPDAIASYLPDIEALVSRHLASWQASGQAGVKAYGALKMLTFDFILQIVMGRSIPEQQLQHLGGLFSSLTAGLVAWPYIDIPFTPWHKALAAREELCGFFLAGCAQAREALAAGQAVPGILGRLVAAVDEQGNRLTDQEITHNLLLVLLAGHDTSSTTLTRALANLQDHPRVLQRLRQEQQQVVARHGGRISSDALKDMRYADAVVRETLRRDPVVGAVIRVATRDFELGGYGVPAGTNVLLPLRTLAETDPRWLHSPGDMAPAAFNPDRMMTPEGAKPGQLMPFGGGARYCLGAALAMAEMKTFLALLARQYAFQADTATEWKPALGYYPANGLPLVLSQLQQQQTAAV
ncbi:hypothetical protein OEZ85_013407 [Tetradesmus obliquus]|uniref:Cytochrome P450 n=1 Tax=Tetradesmus obliquus TaxID=3088 RepID=A0ABY8U5Z5_TETOB|nr:hypothetical protein OEZ85_013407 [Tetradesmus obliquus]